MTAIITEREQQRYAIIRSVNDGVRTNGQAATMLDISVRQVKRLKKVVAQEGISGLVHKLKNKPSNHRIEAIVKEKALEIIKHQYVDFKPLFASEKLQQLQGIVVKPETLRLWMSDAGMWKTRTHKKRGDYRSWRPRKDYYGELEQFDGSYHLWFENRYRDVFSNPIEVCLLASIDDATGKITQAMFAENEGVIAVFKFWRTYLINLGKPLAIYLDKFSTYKINHKSAVDNYELMTQFQRVTKDLNIKLISAHSPQAKGRIERLFGTLQDRLIKELRLARISMPEEGNLFLKEIFIPAFNEKFAVVPEKEGDVHRNLTTNDQKDFNRIFSVQSYRTVNNDFTIQFKNTWYQLEEVQPTTVRAKEKVLMEEWLDETLHMSLRGYNLNYVPLPTRPEKTKTQPVLLTTHRLNWKPPLDHPWRRYRP